MIDGLLNVDKPLEITSHDVVARVRKLAQLRRVGHAGTLDPLASGVLVLALGRSTRLLEYVVGRPKTYRATVRLGQVTTTYDGEGEVVASHPVAVSDAEIESALERFRGEIEQVPPMYSAVKRQGQPLYRLARQGIEVERESRQVTIYALEQLTWEPPLVTLRVTCSSGTYIRSLAHDLGQELGCGAYLSGLRRTAVGSFTIDQALELDHLTSDNLGDHLVAPDRAVVHLPRLELSEEAARRLAQGQWLTRRPQEPAADLVRAYDLAGRFVGMITCEEGQWRPRKILYDPDGDS